MVTRLIQYNLPWGSSRWRASSGARHASSHGRWCNLGVVQVTASHSKSQTLAVGTSWAMV